MLLTLFGDLFLPGSAMTTSTTGVCEQTFLSWEQMDAQGAEEHLAEVSEPKPPAHRQAFKSRIDSACKNEPEPLPCSPAAETALRPPSLVLLKPKRPRIFFFSGGAFFFTDTGMTTFTQSTYIYIYIYIYLHTYTCIFIYTCMYVCNMYIYIYIYVYIYMCMYRERERERSYTPQTRGGRLGRGPAGAPEALQRLRAARPAAGVCVCVF